MGSTVNVGTDGVGSVEQVLSLIDAFGIAELDQVESLASAIVDTVTLEPGEVLCAEGTYGSAWWVIAQGAAVASVADQALGPINVGEPVGEVSALAAGPRVATVTATTPLAAIEIEGETFLDLVMDCPPAARAILRTLAERLRRSNETLVAGELSPG